MAVVATSIESFLVLRLIRDGDMKEEATSTTMIRCISGVVLQVGLYTTQWRTEGTPRRSRDSRSAGRSQAVTVEIGRSPKRVVV